MKFLFREYRMHTGNLIEFFSQFVTLLFQLLDSILERTAVHAVQHCFDSVLNLTFYFCQLLFQQTTFTGKRIFFLILCICGRGKNRNFLFCQILTQCVQHFFFQKNRSHAVLAVLTVIIKIFPVAFVVSSSADSMTTMTTSQFSG